MSKFTFAVQDAVDEVRNGIEVRDREIWFSFLNPMSSRCLLVRSEDVKFFKKCTLVSLLPSLALGAIGAIYSLKNGASKEIELLASLPILISYIIILFVYILTVIRSEKLSLYYRPFIKIAQSLAIRMKAQELVKTLAQIGGFMLVLFVSSLVIYERSFHLVAVVIFVLASISFPPVLLVLTALLEQKKIRR